MLEPKVKSGEIPYEGPYSSFKKIYIFAAGLATLGVGAASGAAALVAVPVTTAGAGAATGG